MIWQNTAFPKTQVRETSITSYTYTYSHSEFAMHSKPFPLKWNVDILTGISASWHCNPEHKEWFDERFYYTEMIMETSDKQFKLFCILAFNNNKWLPSQAGRIYWKFIECSKLNTLLDTRLQIYSYILLFCELGVVVFYDKILKPLNTTREEYLLSFLVVELLATIRVNIPSCLHPAFILLSCVWDCFLDLSHTPTPIFDSSKLISVIFQERNCDSERHDSIVAPRGGVVMMGKISASGSVTRRLQHLVWTQLFKLAHWTWSQSSSQALPLTQAGSTSHIVSACPSTTSSGVAERLHRGLCMGPYPSCPLSPSL